MRLSTAGAWALSQNARDLLTAQQLDDFYEHSERQMAQSLLEARLQRNLLQARFSPWGKNANERRHKTDCRRTHQEAIRNQTVSEFPSPKMLSEVRALDRTLDPQAVRSRFRSWTSLPRSTRIPNSWRWSNPFTPDNPRLCTPGKRSTHHAWT